ncbi:PhzF family phenazine biosynthesis protein [Massilia putida]|uniref:PhzF family phenazine biosynthesis protein n=1 Tax=Massilia putida TaxID=1141883 RepID=UPI0009525080|nr:PhzF family phenazine biosynthesis protein [Massilia putida]
MHIHSLRCFGARPGTGNPALVIEDGDQDPDVRLSLARARDTTCVFLDTSADGALVIDYYYPHKRSPLCIHATLAVAAVLLARDPYTGTIAVRTAVEGQRLELVRTGDDYFVRLSAQPVAAKDVGADTAAALLGVPAGSLATPPRVASIGSPKLLVKVTDTDALYGLAPDLARIAAWSKETGINGIYAWCRRDDGTFEGRNFNHLDPRLEDSATGVAAGALTALLGLGIRLRQGRATGGDCLIRTRMEGGAILVGGAVETF